MFVLLLNYRLPQKYASGMPKADERRSVSAAFVTSRHDNDQSALYVRAEDLATRDRNLPFDRLARTAGSCWIGVDAMSMQADRCRAEALKKSQSLIRLIVWDGRMRHDATGEPPSPPIHPATIAAEGNFGSGRRRPDPSGSIGGSPLLLSISATNAMRRRRIRPAAEFKGPTSLWAQSPRAADGHTRHQIRPPR